METILYWLLRGLLASLQSLPMTWLARFGRGVGALVHLLDGRHRRVATKNLTMCLGAEKSPVELKALVRENFRRIGENFACAVKTAGMNAAQLKNHLQIVGAEKILDRDKVHGPQSRIFAIGHFGNFELFASSVKIAPAYHGATTYRALRGEALNRLLLELRETTGCLFFERRSEGAALRAALRSQLLLLGLLSDQHSGDHGVRIPFFGHDATTTKSPAVFALRFNLPLHTAICFRERLGHWRIEVGDEIPTYENGAPRTIEAIMTDVNRAFEAAVRRDPANWFWVHNRWKVRKPKNAAPPPPEEAVATGHERKEAEPQRSV